jgi:hypothetical protein
LPSPALFFSPHHGHHAMPAVVVLIAPAERTWPLRLTENDNQIAIFGG